MKTPHNKIVIAYNPYNGTESIYFSDLKIIGKKPSQKPKTETKKPVNPNQFAMTISEKELFNRLTALQKNVINVGDFKCGELFIHWHYPDRKIDGLNALEVFHLNMLRYFGIPNGMTKIHIRCACSQKELTNAMKLAINLLEGKAEIDFKIVPNSLSWERDTIKEAAEYAIESGSLVYYTHFKGSSRMAPNVNDRRTPICSFTDVLYWNYLMYRGLFTEQPKVFKAIGPIAYFGINPAYLKINNPNINPRYQFIGSFQAFDGNALKQSCINRGLSTKELRDKFIWNVSTGRYAVEMLLSMMFDEKDVHSYVQLPKKKAAYRMYRDNFCKHLINEFRNPYQPINNIYNRNQKIAICCVAKNEDLYADEWLNHYRKLGVNHFYWFDNNDSKTAKINEISQYPDVDVIDVNGSELEKIGYQTGAYQFVYDTVGEEYEWIGFFDLDEFVEIDSDMSLIELLNRPEFYGATSVSMHWRYFGDNGLVRYEDKPLKKRFTEPAPIDVKYSSKNDENRYVKSFVRTCLPVECGIHTSRFYGSLNRLADGSLREPFEDVGDINLNVAHVNHYGTKTIEEYIKRKCLNVKRASGLNSITNKDRLDWFFNVNEVTEEKLKVIKQMLPNLKYIG